MVYSRNIGVQCSRSQVNGFKENHFHMPRPKPMFFQGIKISYLITKRHNFRLVQIESICIRQHKCKPNIKICFENSRKHYEKRRKCWLPAFSPFRTMFLKAFLLRVIKSQDSVKKGQVYSFKLIQCKTFHDFFSKVQFYFDSSKIKEICRQQIKGDARCKL